MQETHTLKAIAAILAVPYVSLSKYCAAHGVHFRRDRSRKVDEGRLRLLLAHGLTHTTIGTMLDVSKSAIERRVRRLDLQSCRTGPRVVAGHRWRRLEKHGYVLLYVPLHPHGRRSGYVAEHRLLYEVMTRTYLAPPGVVHHRDDHPHHNWPDNLHLYANNAAHLRDELTAREKATPRASIPGAYGNNQTLRRCPSADETLAQCPLETRQSLDWFVESHRPTSAHQTRARQSILRSGAWRDPFGWPTTA